MTTGHPLKRLTPTPFSPEWKRLTLRGVSQPDHKRIFAQHLILSNGNLYTWYRNGTVTCNDQILRVDDWGYNWREMAFLIIMREGLDAYRTPEQYKAKVPILPHPEPPPLHHSTRVYQGQDCLWYTLTLAHAEQAGKMIWRGSWLSIHHAEWDAHGCYEADRKHHLDNLETEFAYYFHELEVKKNPIEYPKRIEVEHANGHSP
jgi:hypothetical protein